MVSAERAGARVVVRLAEAVPRARAGVATSLQAVRPPAATQRPTVADVAEAVEASPAATVVVGEADVEIGVVELRARLLRHRHLLAAIPRRETLCRCRARAVDRGRRSRMPSQDAR